MNLDQNKPLLQLMGELLLPISLEETDDQGFIMTPTGSGTRILYFGVSRGIPQISIDRKKRRRVVSFFMGAANMDSNVPGQSLTGYLHADRKDGMGNVISQLFFIIQSRPTRLGNEIIVRRILESNLTFPTYLLSEAAQCSRYMGNEG